MLVFFLLDAATPDTIFYPRPNYDFHKKVRPLLIMTPPPPNLVIFSKMPTPPPLLITPPPPPTIRKRRVFLKETPLFNYLVLILKKCFIK